MKKVCAFYVSDYHFEMISLPYILKKIESDDEIIILTENNLEKTIKKLVDRINLNEKRKEKILNLDWKDNNKLKLEELKNRKLINRNINIFVKGKEKYIEGINKNIEEIIGDGEKINLINCYNMAEISGYMDEIMKQYKKILKVNGEIEINKL